MFEATAREHRLNYLLEVHMQLRICTHVLRTICATERRLSVRSMICTHGYGYGYICTFFSPSAVTKLNVSTKFLDPVFPSGSSSFFSHVISVLTLVADTPMEINK